MAGPERALSLVPLHTLLPPDLLGPGTPDEMRRILADVESHPAAAERCEWYWFPEATERPTALPPRTSRSLLTLAVRYAPDPSDWLEMTLDLAWYAPPALTVLAAVEVACWCPTNHNIHRVRHLERQVSTPDELLVGLRSGCELLTDALTRGPYTPEEWRTAAGLPGRPPAPSPNDPDPTN